MRRSGVPDRHRTEPTTAPILGGRYRIGVRCRHFASLRARNRVEDAAAADNCSADCRHFAPRLPWGLWHGPEHWAVFVRDGMNRTVVTVGPTHTLREAARRMTRADIGAAVVIDPDGEGPGIFTERDLPTAQATRLQQADRRDRTTTVAIAARIPPFLY